MKNDLRVESRFKNALLYNAIKARFGTIHVFAGVCGVPANTISSLLCLRESPWYSRRLRNLDKAGQWKPLAFSIAEALDTSVEELFPNSLYALKLPQVVVREFSSPDVLSLQEAAQQRLLPMAEITDGSENVAEAVHQALLKLSPKQQKIIESRFGIGDRDSQSLNELAGEFGVTRSRISQIEVRAMKALKHPSISQPLRRALEKR